MGHANPALSGTQCGHCSIQRAGLCKTLLLGRGGCFLKALDSEGCNSVFTGPQEEKMGVSYHTGHLVGKQPPYFWLLLQASLAEEIEEWSLRIEFFPPNGTSGTIWGNSGTLSIPGAGPGNNQKLISASPHPHLLLPVLPRALCLCAGPQCSIQVRDSFYFHSFSWRDYLVVQMPTVPFGKTLLLLHAWCRQLRGAADTTKYLSDRNQLGFTLCCRAFTQGKKKNKNLPCSLKCCFSSSQYFLPWGRGA